VLLDEDVCTSGALELGRHRGASLVAITHRLRVTRKPSGTSEGCGRAAADRSASRPARRCRAVHAPAATATLRVSRRDRHAAAGVQDEPADVAIASPDTIIELRSLGAPWCTLVRKAALAAWSNISRHRDARARAVALVKQPNSTAAAEAATCPASPVSKQIAAADGVDARAHRRTIRIRKMRRSRTRRKRNPLPTRIVFRMCSDSRRARSRTPRRKATARKVAQFCANRPENGSPAAPSEKKFSCPSGAAAPAPAAAARRVRGVRGTRDAANVYKCAIAEICARRVGPQIRKVAAARVIAWVFHIRQLRVARAVRSIRYQRIDV